MQSLRVLVWICSLAGLFCGAPARPDLTSLQLTYDREEAQGSTLHDKGLRIVEASCEAPSDGRSLCQVTFLSKDDPDERLYFDVIAVAQRNGRWELQSGLCKR
jgi:hypothetical protein